MKFNSRRQSGIHLVHLKRNLGLKINLSSEIMRRRHMLRLKVVSDINYNYCENFDIKQFNITNLDARELYPASKNRAEELVHLVAPATALLCMKLPVQIPWLSDESVRHMQAFDGFCYSEKKWCVWRLYIRVRPGYE